MLSYSYAHIGSSDRYASFLLAPAEVKGPFGYAYFRHKSEDLRGAFWKFPRVYFTQAFTYVQLGTFLCRTEEALQTLFLGKGLMLFFKSSGGSVLRTSTISETPSSEPRWLGVFSVWNSLAVTLRFVS